MKIVSNKYRVAAAIGLLIAMIAIHGIFIEPNWLRVRHIYLSNEKLQKNLSGKTVVFLSDLHIEKIGSLEKEVLRKISELQPDIILLSGDYVKWKGNYEPALEFLSKLEAKIGMWAVMGDYDFSNDRQSCLFCHAKGAARPTTRHKVKFLRNSCQGIESNGQILYICGVESNDAAKREHVSEHLPAMNNAQAAIVLTHNPLAFDKIDKDKELLVLAGDTHGGQIAFFPWLIQSMGYEKNRKYNAGIFQNGRKEMFVSKGIGTSHLPVRLFCRPELVILHFSKPTSNYDE